MYVANFGFGSGSQTVLYARHLSMTRGFSTVAGSAAYLLEVPSRLGDVLWFTKSVSACALLVSTIPSESCDWRSV